MKKDIMMVFSTNLVKLGVALFATFILPYFLSVEGYGNIKLYQLYVSYIGVLHLGYSDGVYLKYGGKNLEDNKNNISKDIFLFCIFQIIITFSICIFALYQSDMIILIFGLTILPRNVRNIYEYVYQATGCFKKYTWIVNTYSLLTIIGYFTLIVIFRMKNYKIYIATYCLVDIAIAFFSYVLYGYRGNAKGTYFFDVKRLCENISTGFFLMLGNFATTFLLNIDKWFVKGYMGIESFAYYSFSAQILMLISMFITPVTMTLYTYLSRKKNRYFEIGLLNHLKTVVFAMLCFPFLIEMIISWMLPSYGVSIDIIYILFMAQAIMSLNTAILVNLFKVYKKQSKYFRNLCIIIGVSIFLNWFFYKVYANMISFAFATMVSSIILYMLNAREFKYLRPKKNDILFTVLIICGYYFIHLVFKPIIGFVIYAILFFSMMLVIRREEMLYWLALLRKLYGKYFYRGIR